MTFNDYPATPLAPRYITVEHELAGRFNAVRELQLVGFTRYAVDCAGHAVWIVATVYRERSLN